MRENQDKGMKDRCGPTSENDIIDIKEQNYSGRSLMVDKHRGVRGRTNETMRQMKTARFMEPSSRDLFEVINSFLEFTYMTRKVRVNKPRRLSHINFLSQSAIKKSILDVQLLNKLTKSEG